MIGDRNMTLDYRTQFPQMRRARTVRASAVAAAIAAAALLAGCANRDSIVVGATPDDYRTNHPIVIAEKDVTIDIPVGTFDTQLSRVQRTAIDGFIDDYDRKQAPLVTILVPSGAVNDAAASNIAGALAGRMVKLGVPAGRVMTQHYQARSASEPAPLRVVYTAMRAQTGPCGKWPEDISDTAANKHYANFGCAYQNNLAAQIDNPADLLGPRKMAEVDTERRSVSIEDYRLRESTWTPEVGY